MTASALVYVAAGAPAYPGDTAGVCRWCGAAGVGEEARGLLTLGGANKIAKEEP